MDKLINNLSAIVGNEKVLYQPDELLVYECDGLPHHKHRPRAVVFPSTTEETSAVMKELSSARVPFTPRGAGTGLSGGALALNQGVVVEMARMRKILNIDVQNRLAVVQPGVVNLQVSKAVAPFGLYYVPDPSSQPTCTIGGNIAESAGGIHCLKYGTTTDHVLGCTVVLAGGEIVELGGSGKETPGFDLLGTFVGSEGTFGIVTEATLRLVQSPPAVRTLLAEFGEVNDASHAVSAIIAAGLMPAALEMMDHVIIRAVEASVFAAGLPPDAGAALLIELDGIEAGLDDEAERVTSLCMEFGARSCRRARDDNERKKLWAARKGAFGAIGRISPDSMIQDAVVPRSRLPQVLAAAYDIAQRYELRIANVFHAGDGNLHPLICFDSRSADQVRRVKEAGRELMETCVANGGTITGEHGVGLDKRELLPLVFSEDDMNAMLSVRAAFDPDGLMNPGKIVPMLRGCGEGRAVALPETRDVAAFPQTSRQIPSNGNNQPSSFDQEVASAQLRQLVNEVETCASGKLIVAPDSIEAVSEILKLAGTKCWRVLPSGGANWLNAKAVKSANLVLSTKNLNRIIEHEPADLIAVAQAGVRLVEFNETLARNGQWLPLDPPDDGSATLGGVVATGISGAQEFGYGRPRGSVIGMKVVLGDGSIISVGGRVVKNVAGYDLCKLFTGSYGTLGIITELNFKLRPTPAAESTLIATGKRTSLIIFAHSIISAALFPVAVELVSAKFASALGIQVDDCALLIRFAGTSKAVQYQMKEALSIDVGVSVQSLTDDDKLWRDVAQCSVCRDGTLGWRASMLPLEVEKFLTTLEKSTSLDDQTWQVGLANGRMRMVEEIESNAVAARIENLNAIARASDATIFVEGSNFSSQISEANMKLMRRIKERLDPRGVLVDLD